VELVEGEGREGEAAKERGEDVEALVETQQAGEYKRHAEIEEFIHLRGERV